MALAVAGAANFVDAGASSSLVPGDSPWQTIVDYNFRIQTPTTIPADGTLSMGGVTFEKLNSANDDAAMSVGGPGLIIQPTQQKNYNFFEGGIYEDSSGHRQCPLLRVPFSQFSKLALLSWQSRIRLWVALVPQSTTFSGNYRTFAALDAPSAAGANPPAGMGVSVWAGGGSFNVAADNAIGINYLYWASSTGDVQSNNNGRLSPAFDQNHATVLLLETERLDALPLAFLYSGALASGGANFPAYDSLTPEDAATIQSAIVPRSQLPADPRNMGVVFGACCTTDVATAPSTIQRFRLDVLL